MFFQFFNILPDIMGDIKSVDLFSLGAASFWLHPAIIRDFDIFPYNFFAFGPPFYV